MKTIGLVGGMSWESTAIYYQLINERVRILLGGLHSASIILVSVDFAELESFQRAGQWEMAAAIITDSINKLERAGADFAVICSVTGHESFDRIAASVQIPILHVSSAISRGLKLLNLRHALFLGTRYSMEKDYIRNRLSVDGFSVCAPSEADRVIVNDIIYNELCRGVVSSKSITELIRIVNESMAMGVNGVIFGCTELSLVAEKANLKLPWVDSLVFHVDDVVNFALGLTLD